VRICESQALGGESIDVRCADGFCAVATDVAIAEIVSVDEDDVGFGRWLRGTKQASCCGCAESLEELSAIHR